MKVFKLLLVCLFAFSVQTGISKSAPPAGENTRDTVKCMVVTTTKAGELSTQLDSINYYIDSLVVKGPIDSSDFSPLWHASIRNVRILNLEDADVENRKIPNAAFWHGSEQYTGHAVGIISLKEIILPNNIKTIGSEAFCYCGELRKINIPDSLKSIGELAFYSCRRLDMDSLVFPEGLEEIPRECFFDCRSLSGSVILPSTIKTIGSLSFYLTRITGLTLPEGLDSIGDYAFSACRCKDVTIPASCKKIGDAIFGYTSAITTLRFAEGTTYIPANLVSNCIFLERVYFPSTTEEIAARALEGLEYVDSLTLPASLTKIGSRAFADMKGLKYIKSEALTPPECVGAGMSNHEDFWGTVPENLPVFVPKGTKEQYEATLGWNYFTNIQEYDDTDPTGISAISDNAGKTQPYSIYTVNGELVARGTTTDTAINTSLPHGIYVVKIGGKTFKKAL